MNFQKHLTTKEIKDIFKQINGDVTKSIVKCPNCGLKIDTRIHHARKSKK